MVESTGSYPTGEGENRKTKRFEIEAPDELLDRLHAQIVNLPSSTVLDKIDLNQMWEIGYFRFGSDYGNSEPLEMVRIGVIRDKLEGRDEMNLLGFITTEFAIAVLNMYRAVDKLVTSDQIRQEKEEKGLRWHIPDSSGKNTVYIDIMGSPRHTIGGLEIFFITEPISTDNMAFKDGVKHFLAVVEDITNGLLPGSEKKPERMSLNDPRIVDKFELTGRMVGRLK